MKYAQKISELFETMVEISPKFNCSQNVTFFKATHELDGQTYILKKIRIFVKNDEEIKDHPWYDEISKIKDNKLPFEIRYINSWIELDENLKLADKPIPTNGLYVFLCIQMRYTKNFTKLASDLIISKRGQNDDLDEDTIYDLAEDTLNISKDLHKNGKLLKDSIVQSFKGNGYDDSQQPKTTEEQTWRICFEDLLEAS